MIAAPNSREDVATMPGPEPDGTSQIRFIAYVYPGWHQTPYRPGIDEWALLDGFVPRFSGHEMIPLPLAGRYDDSTAETARRHRDTALAAGISGFTYFVYYRPGTDFVMADPIHRMIEILAPSDAFVVGTTWCIRLPHDRFPVDPGDELEVPGRTDLCADLPLQDRPIESLSLADIDELLGPKDRIWSETLIESGFMSAAARSRRRSSGTVDAAPLTSPRSDRDER